MSIIKERSTIVVSNYSGSCENQRCSCHHKQRKILSKEYSGTLRQFDCSTLLERRLVQVDRDNKCAN